MPTTAAEPEIQIIGTRHRHAVSVALSCAALYCGCSATNSDDGHLSDSAPPESTTDYALQFDGVNDYATVGTARVPLPTVAQTVSFWVRLDSIGTVQSLVTLRRDDSGNEFGLSETGVPTLWRIWGRLVLVEATQPLAIGEWYHLAYVYDLTQHALYVNGVLDSTGTNSPNNRSPTSGWVGSFDGSQNLFKGRLDELRLWAIARTDAEVLAEFESGGPTSDPDLVGYYSFNEDEGTRVYDRSGKGNHMALGDGVAETAPARVLSDRP